MPVFQTVGQKRLDRGRHVWKKLRGKEAWKCVLCGGISATPSDDCVPDRVERLTQEERDLCPMESWHLRSG